MIKGDYMNENQIREIVSRVLSSIDNSEASIPVEASARHVHLTKEAVEVLFGKGSSLTKKRDLSQPGDFLSEQ